MPVYKYYPSQKVAATKVIDAFTSGGKHYALLWALCQSGKTGTFHWVAKQMLLSRQVKRVYLLCGSAEVCLRTQAEADALLANPNPADPSKSLVQVIFRPSFKKTRLDIEDALIIIDESHLDQSKGMELDQLLTRHGLVLTGDCPTAVANRCRILSVSATPYAEVSALHSRLAAGLVADKAIVRLEPGPGYYGIEQFLRDGRIKSTESDLNLSTATGPEITAFLKKPEFALKWNIMRVKNAIHLRAITKAAKSVGIFVKSYTAKSTDLAITEAERKERVDEQVAKAERNTPKAKQTAAWKAAIRAKAKQDHPWLGVAPLRTTVILLKDRLRAGKVVPKDHIGFVWEDSASSKTDVLVQALLGRMCGYYTAGTYKPMIYLPKAVLAEHEDKVIKASELQRAISTEMIPRNFAHSAGSSLATAVLRHQCVPILLNPLLVDEEERWTTTFYNKGNNEYNRRTKERCFRALRALRDTTAFEPFTAHQLVEVDRILSVSSAIGSTTSHIRHMQGSSQASWFQKMINCSAAGTSMRGIEEISYSPDLTFVVVYDGYMGGGTPGQAYAIFYTDAPNAMDSLHTKHRFGTTDTQEVYSPGEAPLPSIWGSGLVPAASVGLPKDCFANSTSFAAEFGKILSSGLHIKGSCIEDAEVGYFTFQREGFGFLSHGANHLETICKDLGDELGKKITIRYHPEVAGLTRKHTFRVTRISWAPTGIAAAEDPI